MKFLNFLAITLMMTISFGGHAKELTYEQFKESCESPANYGHQRPPAEIKLMCRDVFTAWRAIESGAIKLSESRLISGELFSDKYHVNTTEFGISVPERSALCPRFREVLETASVEVNLTCDLVLSSDKGIEDMCREALDQLIAENPEAVESKPTGRTYSACSDVTQK